MNIKDSDTPKKIGLSDYDVISVYITLKHYSNELDSEDWVIIFKS